MYVFSLVANSEDEMTKFFIGVSKYLVKDCLTAILHDNVDLGRLIVHA